MPKRLALSLAAAALIATTVGSASAEEAYYRVPLADVSDDAIPPQRSDQTIRCIVDGEGEAFVREDRSLILLARGPAGTTIQGRVFLPASSRTEPRRIDFKITPDLQLKDARSAFYRAKARHYASLARQPGPGSAWFRHQEREARARIGDDDAGSDATGSRRPLNGLPDIDRTVGLMTGSRAMAENLALDAVLEVDKEQDRTIAIESIDGVTVTEVDWAPLIEGKSPKLDALAQAIPSDQPALFFPSLAAATKFAVEFRRFGLPVLELSDIQVTEDHYFERYERQLGLSLSATAARIDPSLVDSIAMTASDPYFAEGTDFALLIETPNADALFEQLETLRALDLANRGVDANESEGRIGAITFSATETDDRRVSSFLAKSDKIVLLANSEHQLKQLVSVAKGERTTLDALPEFAFFRDRYPLDDENETVLLILSDATIRRWCSPRWRIAGSRRMRQAAVLAELQAAHAEELLQGVDETRTIATDLPTLDGAQWRLTPEGVRSSVYGSLEFMTPIAELPIDKVTAQERQSYERWRSRYEGTWRVFDPIAMQFTIDDDRLATDVTVIPLNLRSQYRSLVRLTQGASFQADDGDPHDALLHGVMSLDVESPDFRMGANLLENVQKGLTLSWIGDHIAVYVDDGPIWKEIAAEVRDGGDVDNALFSGRRFDDIPLAVHVDSRNSLQLAMFVAATRAYMAQTSPETLVWEAREHNGTPYVRVTLSESERESAPEGFRDVGIHYTTAGGALLVTLSERVMQDAIDRRLARKASKEDDGETTTNAEATRPWLGENLAFRIDGKLFQMSAPVHQRQTAKMTERSLPILSEYKRWRPDRDPVALHEDIWGERLLCPGGQFVWDEEHGEMTIEWDGGRNRPTSPSPIEAIRSAEFGVTFEHDGLRAKGVVHRVPMP